MSLPIYVLCATKSAPAAVASIGKLSKMVNEGRALHQQEQSFLVMRFFHDINNIDTYTIIVWIH